MSFGTWLRNLFSSGPSRDDESVEQEEYGLPDRGEAEIDSDAAMGGAGFGLGSGVGYAGSGAAQVAEEDLDELKPPPDPAP